MKLRLGGTQLELSYPLLCLAALSVLLGFAGDLVWCAAAIVLHEGGHLLMMARFGYFPEKIKISLFAIDITDHQRQRRSTRENGWIIFFGPFANFICFLPCFLLYLKGVTCLLPFAAANLSVGVFNCLPVASLDGGMLLHLLLCRVCTPDRAERIVDRCTLVCIVPLGALGIWLLLREKNASLLFVCGCLAAALLRRSDDTA